MANKIDKKLMLGAVVAFVLLAAGFLVFGPLKPTDTNEINVSAEQVDDVLTAFDGTAAAEASAPVAIDVDSATKERILGDPGAPIKISEHSSFTCGHCGQFHQNTFEAFKKAYIDSGKAYLVFSDFPLNGPALQASMIGRCIPEERYFEYVEDLYKDQESWAYERNYLQLLEQKAAVYGLDAAGVKACLGNTAIQEAIINRMNAVKTQFGVDSTPSFVVNNQVVIAGALPFEQFEQELQKAVQQIENPNSESAGEGE